MRAIKKRVALATGATMLGATVMGAMAADLANYPAPFVDGCSFSGAIVVGDNAAAEDVIGAVDISSTLLLIALARLYPISVLIIILSGVFFIVCIFKYEKESF